MRTNPKPLKTKKGFPSWLTALVVFVLIAIGVFNGYGRGMRQRLSAESTLVSGQLQEQYQLGQQAMDAGQYDLAKQHFEFVIQQDPGFTGVQTTYQELLLLMQASPTPLFTPTPIYTATPETRSPDQIFNHIQDLLKSSSWDEAITNLDELRKLDPADHTAQVDGMYYIALRQRGMSKILNPKCQNINLEGGIYDLTLAERFVGVGHLDANAEAYRTWARMYITGASFWDQDWAQAQNYFAQVMTALPDLSDSSCLTATERWRQATENLAQQH